MAARSSAGPFAQRVVPEQHQDQQQDGDHRPRPPSAIRRRHRSRIGKRRCRPRAPAEQPGRSRVGPCQTPLPPRDTFEYATVPLITHATKAILDTWGEDGWELVQVVPGPNPEQLVAYLKRERA